MNIQPSKSITSILATSLIALTLLLFSAPVPAADPKPKLPDKPAAPDKAPAAPALTFEPGKETKIDDPAAFDKHHILFVPKDYTPDREWPIIVCYHGVGGVATVWPFADLVDRQGWVIVGMSYLAEKGGDLEAEYASLKRVVSQVGATVRLNPKMVFIGGFSLGGVWTYRLSNRDPNLFAGVVAMGMAGRVQGTPDTWRAKPVLIAHGETDPYCPKDGILGTVDSYAKVGAAVTHEVFKGLAHAVDTKNEVVKKWLADNGPLSTAKVDFENARAAEKANKLGPAFTLYTALAKNQAGGQYGKSAADAAKLISDVADTKFAAAEEAVSTKKYPAAIKALVGIEQLYKGSTLSEKAKDRLAQIQKDPAIKAEIEQARIDSAADTAEAQATTLEKSKDFGRAIAIYERYLTEYPAAKRFPEVKAHLEALKADKSLTVGIANKQMENDCKSWLNMADNYTQAGLTEKAKSSLEKVIEKYPDSPFAKTAREKLAAMK